jgi:hypothetical protein
MPQLKKHASNKVTTGHAQFLYTAKYLTLLLIKLQMNAKFGKPVEIKVTQKLQVLLCQNFHK